MSTTSTYNDNPSETTILAPVISLPKESMGLKIKNHVVAFLGEFVGTFLFLFFAFAGTQTANQQSSQTDGVTGPDLIQLLYISTVFGFSLAINVWVFFRISGGLFNPAVTLALCVCGVNGPIRSIFIFVAQILGGIAASGAVRGMIPGYDVLFKVRLQAPTTVAQGFFLELFFTTELVFTILMLAAEKTKATFVAPVGIGLALFIAELVGVYWTGGAVNPARAFGPEVIAGAWPGYHWLYWIAPFLGALLASAFYKLMKYLDYEDVNGDQDKTEEDQRLEDLAKAQRKQQRGSWSKRMTSTRMRRRPAANAANTAPRTASRQANSHPFTPATKAGPPVIGGDISAAEEGRAGVSRSAETEKER